MSQKDEIYQHLKIFEIEHKECSRCKIVKPEYCYYKRKKIINGSILYTACKICVAEANKIYRESEPGNRSQQRRSKRYEGVKISGMRNRTPSWVNKEHLKEIYRNRPEGHEVDHIIPLRGKTVSGLHVPWNLQYLTISDNRTKSNKL